MSRTDLKVGVLYFNVIPDGDTWPLVQSPYSGAKLRAVFAVVSTRWSENQGWQLFQVMFKGERFDRRGNATGVFTETTLDVGDAPDWFADVIRECLTKSQKGVPAC